MGGKGKKNTFQTAATHITRRPSKVSHFANLTSSMFSVNKMLPKSVSELKAHSLLLLFTPSLENVFQIALGRKLKLSTVYFSHNALI